jgi:glycosyltransferase involved in cell wall biosynthesis
MRVALLSTCAVSTPPKGYGGTELVASELAKGLTRRGHEVTVFATGNSRPGAELVAHFAQPVWPPDELAELRHAAFSWMHISRASPRFDVVHCHQAPSISFSSVSPLPVVVTIHHHRVDSLVDYYLDFPRVSFVAISKRQAELLPELRCTVIHHGVDPDLYPAGEGLGGYFAFVGRLAPEKGAHVAIDATAVAGGELWIGGTVHPCDHEYFTRDVEPRLGFRHVRWLREVHGETKGELLRGAKALLFPIDWEEPFGLVMIEAMLSGTPVIAFPRGSAPEVIEDGVTGFLVRTEAEMVDRMRRIGSIDRLRCRARAIERFSTARMTRDYERVYEDAMSRAQARHPPALARVRA